MVYLPVRSEDPWGPNHPARNYRRRFEIRHCPSVFGPGRIWGATPGM